MEQNAQHSEKETQAGGHEAPTESLQELARKAKQTEKELEDLKRRILELQNEIRRRLKEGDYGSNNP